MSLYRINRKQQRYKPLTDKCIILDLDETLVHSSENYLEFLKLDIIHPKFLDLRRRLYSFSFNGYKNQSSIWGITRPKIEDFIPFCFDYFNKVCVWSAGNPDYVYKIVDIIFPPGYEPHVIYTRNHCYYSQDREIFKPIERMIQNENLNGIMKLENTFFIDDRELAFIKNPNNGIIIPPYEPNPNIDALEREDNRLEELMEWFLKPEVINSKDIKNLDKNNIFNK